MTESEVVFLQRLAYCRMKIESGGRVNATILLTKEAAAPLSVRSAGSLRSEKPLAAEKQGLINLYRVFTSENC